MWWSSELWKMEWLRSNWLKLLRTLTISNQMQEKKEFTWAPGKNGNIEKFSDEKIYSKCRFERINRKFYIYILIFIYIFPITLVTSHQSYCASASDLELDFCRRVLISGGEWRDGPPERGEQSARGNRFRLSEKIYLVLILSSPSPQPQTH